MPLVQEKQTHTHRHRHRHTLTKTGAFNNEAELARITFTSSIHKKSEQ